MEGDNISLFSASSKNRVISALFLTMTIRSKYELIFFADIRKGSRQRRGW